MSLGINDFDNKVYIVLGMHHSGTSFLSKALYDQGVHMGTVPSGHYENQDAVRLNSQMLGGDWAYPRKVDKNFSEDIQAFINKHESNKWGFKDPRTSLTVDNYLPHLEDDDVYLIAIFRKPAKVKNSLRRMDYNIKDYDELIDRYNKSIIGSIKKFVGL